MLKSRNAKPSVMTMFLNNYCLLQVD